MKLSAPYRVSDDPLNTRPDPAWLTAILERAKERCLWGSDWPHTPGHDAQHGPEVAGVYRPLPYKTVVDDFIAALGSDALSQMIMSDNPARLYGFSFARVQGAVAIDRCGHACIPGADPKCCARNQGSAT